MHEAKRPRLTGSFSPASPPYHLAKGIEQHTQRQGGFQHPQTPTSPPAQSMGSLPTNAPSTTSTVNTQLTEDTPASSVAGPVTAKNEDQDDDIAMAEGGAAAARVNNESVARKAGSHMRTDHERIQEGMKIAATSTDDDIQEFLLDVSVGPLYLLSQRPFSRSNPHPSQNLFATYNLNSIASSVARFDPVTGSKTNKLRKTYKGYYKELGVSGKEKAVDGHGDFQALMRWPEEEYRNQRMGTEREIRRGMEPEFEARLAKALQMPVPAAKLPSHDEVHWKETLGTDEPVKGVPAAGLQQQQQPHQLQPHQGGGIKKQAPMVGSVDTPTARAANVNGRPERHGKKRRYDDTSFAGYGEGYEDDGADGGSDDESLLSRRKRMKA